MKPIKQGVLIAYRARSRMPPKNEVKLHRELYGYENHSQYGKYTYDRKGVLEGIPHIRPLGLKALLVLKEQDTKKVLRILSKYKAETYVRKITLEKGDLEHLETES